MHLLLRCRTLTLTNRKASLHSATARLGPGRAVGHMLCEPLLIYMLRWTFVNTSKSAIAYIHRDLVGGVAANHPRYHLEIGPAWMIAG